MYGLPLRKGVSVKLDAVFLNRDDLHMIAADLEIAERDILFKDLVLTIYNTSDMVNELIENNSLISFLAMNLDLTPEVFSDYKAVEEERVKMDFDLSDFEDDDD